MSPTFIPISRPFPSRASRALIIAASLCAKNLHSSFICFSGIANRLLLGSKSVFVNFLCITKLQRFGEPLEYRTVLFAVETLVCLNCCPVHFAVLRVLQGHYDVKSCKAEWIRSHSFYCFQIQLQQLLQSFLASHLGNHDTRNTFQKQTGLFVYDIFWVFLAPVMVSVAKSFDAPIKLLSPTADSTRPFSMLGLGDIVIPGSTTISTNVSDWNDTEALYVPRAPTLVNVLEYWTLLLGVSKGTAKEGPGSRARSGSTCPAPKSKGVAGCCVAMSIIGYPFVYVVYDVVIRADLIAAGLHSGCAALRMAAKPLI
ncbi:hypothetical protein Ahy_B06g085927 isoform A [Arachis hypogaea]|uniref:Uncharacterized protein n=1 Tax=Arachis hypogaea TaxID=3818 RepID=A0A444YW78_ARAHY|nr:hypothetical protein Ahy_B06g085927 isoform A [Arachis hypogaea]